MYTTQIWYSIKLLLGSKVRQLGYPVMLSFSRGLILRSNTHTHTPFQISTNMVTCECRKVAVFRAMAHCRKDPAAVLACTQESGKSAGIGGLYDKGFPPRHAAHLSYTIPAVH